MWTEARIGELLRGDAPALALGVVFVVVGLGALAMFQLRPRSRDRALFWFAPFALLYGLRLLGSTETVGLATGWPEAGMAYGRSAITYLIQLPALFFLRELFPRWRRVLSWLIAAQATFAIAGLAADQWKGRPESLGVLNNIMVLTGSTALTAWLFLREQATAQTRALKIGLVCFYVTVVVANLRSLGVRLTRLDPEPLGFAVLLAAAGQIVARRVFENEERLGALDKELEIARRIQESILPRELPGTAHLRIAARYEPMTAVAGDFYDFLAVDERRLGVLVADVSGHGVGAALIASMVKVAIAAQLPHADDPARVLEGLNRTLCGNLQGHFVTAAYLFLDLGEGRMRYAAAGHPPLLWWSAARRETEEIAENGLMLGVFPRAGYSAVEQVVTAGDRFLLYTDGLVEAVNEIDEFFGKERVRAVLADATSAEPERCAQRLLDELKQWAGHSRGRAPDDDLTLLVVGVSPEASFLRQ